MWSGMPDIPQPHWRLGRHHRDNQRTSGVARTRAIVHERIGRRFWPTSSRPVEDGDLRPERRSTSPGDDQLTATRCRESNRNAHALRGGVVGAVVPPRSPSDHHRPTPAPPTDPPLEPDRLIPSRLAASLLDDSARAVAGRLPAQIRRQGRTASMPMLPMRAKPVRGNVGSRSRRRTAGDDSLTDSGARHQLIGSGLVHAPSRRHSRSGATRPHACDDALSSQKQTT